MYTISKTSVEYFGCIEIIVTFGPHRDMTNKDFVQTRSDVIFLAMFIVGINMRKRREGFLVRLFTLDQSMNAAQQERKRMHFDYGD